MAVAAVAALTLVGAAPVDARTRRIESFVRDVEWSTDLDERVDQIEGVVEAKTDRCIGDRDVEVYADPHGEARLFGRANTDDDGSFEVQGLDAADLDYAIAVFAVRRDRLRCLEKGVVVRIDAS